jgi:EmrB/QacA subfamily drug resistance transporter
MSGEARRTITLVVLAAAVSAFALLQSLVLPVLTTIAHDLHTTQATATWVLTAYLLSASICTPILGRLGDMFGKERMLVVALGALAVGSVLAAVAGSIGVMIIARVIQGAGGGVLPLSFGIIRDEFPARRVAGLVGLLAGMTAASSAIGTVLAGPIVSVLSYRWLFWLPAIVVTACTVCARLVIPRSTQRSPGRISWAGALLLSGWLVALLLAVSEAPTWGWGSTGVLVLLAVAAVLGVAWVWVETRSEHPLIDMAMMRMPVVWTTNLVAFLFGVDLYSTSTFVLEYVQAPVSSGYGFGASVSRAGFLMLPMGASMFAFSLASGRLTSRFGSKALLVVGSAVGVVAFFVLSFAHDRPWEIALAMGILGTGFGLAFSAMSSLVVEGVEAHQTGVASGMNANIRTIGGAIGAAVVSSVIAATVTADGLPTEAGYSRAFQVLTVAAVAGTLAALLVPTRRHHLTEAERHDALPHAELGIVAAGTLVGTDPE